MALTPVLTAHWDDPQSFEIENYKMSDALLNLVMERFKLGEATIVDVKQAQQSFETAGFRLTSLQFSAKIAEIELKRMSNQLSF